MNDKIYIIPERLLQEWCCESVVASSLNSVLTGECRQPFNIHALDRGISRRLDVKHPDRLIFFKYFFCFSWITEVGNNRFNSQRRQYLTHQFFCTAIE